MDQGTACADLSRKEVMSKPRNNDLKIQVYRSTAMQLAHEWLKESPEDWLEKGIDPERIRYDFITTQALDLSYLWGSEEGFPWEEIPTWKRKDRKGIDISLWYDQELCGLCYASPRQSALCIKVILLEGKPDVTHPLKGEVAPLALLVISRYARMLGFTEIEIDAPALGAIPYYEEIGFTRDSQDRLVIPVDHA